MNNYEVIIGIENHIELKTKTKMFSPSLVSYGERPNTMVWTNDLGYLGSLPTVNKEGVRLAVLACHALGMEIDPLLRFDRKHYYYTDLPKGYQITQQYFPIGKSGGLQVCVNGEYKTIEIERLHIEEDTAKQNKKEGLLLIDYNRSGIGLIEIVTKPVMHSADEACAYVEKLREILLFLKISDVKMNEGSLRTDVNISLRPVGAKHFGPKVEIKNINSINNMRRAIEFEIVRQTKIILSGEIPTQQTRRFDDATNSTILMRKKVDTVDYKYITESNIAPILLDSTWIEDIIGNMPQTADQKRIKYSEMGINEHDANIILTSIELTNFFEQTITLTNQVMRVLNLLISDVQSELNKQNKSIDQIHLTPNHLAELVNLVEEEIISSKHIKTILPLILNSNDESPKQIVERLNLKLISDEKTISELLIPIMEKNTELLSQFKDRPERVLKTLMGELMKITNGNINPEIANNILINKLNKNTK